MEADPLYHVKQLFYQGSFKAAIDEASLQSLTPGSDYAAPERAVYVARAHLALSPPNPSAADAVLAPFLALDPAPASARAAASLSAYLSGTPAAADEVRDVLLEIEDAGAPDEGTVRALAGTVFVLEGENEEAVATLSEGAGREDLECIALLVQVLLALDRRDLANAQYAAAKAIGNDSALVQAVEAWIGLKTGARPLHQAYYFYEELYQIPNGRTAPVLAGHAAAHLLLGHVEEAKADITEAKATEAGSQSADVLAVATSLGDEDAAVKLAATSHPFAKALATKSAEFDEAAAKFTIAV